MKLPPIAKLVIGAFLRLLLFTSAVLIAVWYAGDGDWWIIMFATLVAGWVAGLVVDPPAGKAV